MIFLFELSCGHLVVIFISLEGFPESRKNWSFRPPRPCWKVSVLLISHFCIFLLQVSKFFTFELSCDHLVMIFINYSGFPESRKKIEVFDDCGPVEKANFSYFPNYACFSSKWVNYYIWVVLWSSGDDFHHFRRLSRRSKKLSFRWLWTCRKANFFLLSQLCIFLIKMSEFLHLSVLWSSGDDFHHFRRLSRKLKKLKFSTTSAQSKKCQFCLFKISAYFSSKSVIFYSLVVLWSADDFIFLHIFPTIQ